MNKGKTIFSIGQILMIIGSLVYILDLLFIESARFSTLITYKLGPELAQKLPATITSVLAVVYAVAIVLMLIGWIAKRGAKKED